VNAEGGSTGASHATRASESPLSRGLKVVRSPGASRWGYFLRAETMHGLYTYLEANPSPTDARFHELSHGESFLEVLRRRFDGSGFYALDEPESALSFTSCLALVGVLHDLAASGTAQVLVATHSPVVAAVPGARILEVGEHGLRETTWGELDLVAHHRTFLDNPELYLRHVIG
jgi:predicted ATPase